MLTDDIIVKNYSNYKSYLIKILGEEVTDELILSLGGDDKIMRATYANTADSGCAFDGSFVKCAIKMTKYAGEINGLLPENLQVAKESLYKVGLLCQIAKVISYEPNDSTYEVNNRGIIYKYVDLEGALRIGERSALIAMNAGVKFTPNEFEAMRILDKGNDDNFTKAFSSPLSMIIRQANEIITMLNKSQK